MTKSNLFYLPITTEEESQFVVALAREYASKDIHTKWKDAKNLIITDCKHKYLVTLPGDFKEISKHNLSYKSNLCDLATMKVQALKIFIMRG